MTQIFLFWDLLNDTPEILGEDGEFYSYGEDSVAIDQGNGGRYWMKLCKISNVHPLNSSDRFEIFDPRLDCWTDLSSTDIETYREVFKLAGAQCLE